MMNKKNAAFALLLVTGIFTFINSCKKPDNSQPLEPISLVQPDSAQNRVFAGGTQAIQIKFTTDRPINYVQCLVDVDTLIDSSNYTPTYPDTLFCRKLDTLNPRVNLYTYTGSYTVPDTLPPFSVVYFNVSFQAGSRYFITGQNYPAGLVSATKQFRINVR
jgi:hypothetical protein